MNFVEANTFEELSDDEKRILENFLDNAKFEDIRNKVSMFNEFESAEWIKKSSVLPRPLRFFLLGYYFSTRPVRIVKELSNGK